MLPFRRTRTFTLLATLAAAACSTDPTNPAIDARARFVNASPDAPSLEVLFDGQTVVSALESQAFTPYLIVNAGTPALTMRRAGTADPPVLTASPTLAAGSDYTVVALGLFASIQSLVLTDDNSIPTAGTVRLRGLHVAPSGSGFDVYITAPGADLAGAQPTFSALAFGNATAYTTLSPGQYQIRLTQPGQKVVEVDGGNFSFAGREVHSIFILDAAGGGTPLGVAAVVDASTGV